MMLMMTMIIIIIIVTVVIIIIITFTELYSLLSVSVTWFLHGDKKMEENLYSFSLCNPLSILIKICGHVGLVMFT